MPDKPKLKTVADTKVVTPSAASKPKGVGKGNTLLDNETFRLGVKRSAASIRKIRKAAKPPLEKSRVPQMPFDLIKAPHDPVCPVCKDVFQQKRSDQRYCSPNCRKQHYQKKDRAEKPRNAQQSPEVAAENRRQHERAKDLARNLYQMPPSCRLGYMKDLIDAARNGDALLRSIFTNPNLLKASWFQPWLFHNRRCPVTYMTISQAGNEYCKRFWRSSVGPVVKNEVAEPETGEVIE